MAKCLEEIYAGRLKHLIDGTNFLQDGLFCEWAYFIDFEERELEVWASGALLETLKFEELGEGKKAMERVDRDYRRKAGDDVESEGEDGAKDGRNSPPITEQTSDGETSTDEPASYGGHGSTSSVAAET
jgi:hypothetical protein